MKEREIAKKEAETTRAAAKRIADRPREQELIEATAQVFNSSLSEIILDFIGMSREELKPRTGQVLCTAQSKDDANAPVRLS